MKTNPLVVCLILVLISLPAVAQERAVDPFADFTRAWRNSSVWYDGKAECAVYDATRTIYGKERHYTARIFTNKENVSSKTFTKSADGAGREVFKHHVRDDIPTENYTYHYSTMTYVGADDLKSLKLDMGSQEDCGATFKQYVNHAGTLRWNQYSYFPGEGERSGEMTPMPRFAFQNALALILRSYPFDAPPENLELQLLPDQRDNHLTLPDELAAGESSGGASGNASGGTSGGTSGVAPGMAVVQYRGKETLELPIGTVDAHHLVVSTAAGPQEHYWFAKAPDMLHVLVQYQGGPGISYRLKSLERRAYWR